MHVNKLTVIFSVNIDIIKVTNSLVKNTDKNFVIMLIINL